MSTARHVGRILSAWGIPAAVALSLLAICAQNTAIFQAADRLAYDRFVRLDSQLTLAPARVLLVYADADLEQQPERYWQLLRRLRHEGAAGVGILQLDIRRWKPDQVRRLTRWNGLVLGHVTGPESSIPVALTCGSVDLIRASDGVYRCYGGFSPSTGLSSLATEVARKHMGRADDVPCDEYGIRFRRGAESLPHVSAESVLRGEVTAALVRDRIVLIGRPTQPAIPDLTTPTSDTHGMPVLEFHGHALNTLLVGRPLTTLPQHLQWGLFMAVAILFPSLARRARLNCALPLFAIVWLVQAASVWLVFWRLQIWVPLGSLTLIEVTASLWSFDQRLRFSERAWQILRRRGFVVSPRYRNPPSLHDGQAPSAYISSMLQQLFPLDNVALLRIDPWRKRLEQILCRGEIRPAVLETRNDLDKQPFAAAMRRRAAVRIDHQQSYFSDDASQRQYFVPLFHAGQLQGALIVGLSSAADDKLPGLEKQLTELSAELATWLAYYRKLHLANKRRGRWWMRWAMPSEVTTFDLLELQINAIDRRLHQADQIIEQSQLGRAVFDLSGDVVTMNATMYRLLHACDIRTTDTQVLEVIRSLSKRDVRECRELIRRVIVNQQSERIVVADPAGRHSMLMMVQPVLRPQQLAHDPAAIQVFSVQGIDIELLPGELMGELHSVREHAAEQTLAAANESLADVSHLTAQLKQAGPEALSQIQATVDRARFTVQRCQTILANGQSEDLDVLLPVEIATIVRAAMVEMRAITSLRGISISVNLPGDLPDISANPQRLRQVIVSSLLVMIEHARENSLIAINGRCHMDHVIVTIENEGCGVALGRIVQHHRTQPNQVPSELSRLLTLRQWLTSWGGDLLVDADLGERACIHLSLHRFAWSDVREANDLAASTANNSHTPSWQ